MSNTPIASYYARTPSAMRCMRLLLQHWPDSNASALYIGCARGEDFYSWYPVGWGTGTELNWVAIDKKLEAVQYCQHCGPDDVSYQQVNFMRDCPVADFVIANRVWTGDMRNDSDGLAAIMSVSPAVVFTRGLKGANGIIRDKYSEYEIYSHRDQSDDHRSNVKGLVIIKRGVFDIETLTAPEVKLCQLD